VSFFLFKDAFYLHSENRLYLTFFVVFFYEGVVLFQCTLG